jgi:hypothetical protein
MNDFDEFAEIALAIYVALTLLIWFLAYLERTLVDPASQHRDRRRVQPPRSTASSDEPSIDPRD